MIGRFVRAPHRVSPRAARLAFAVTLGCATLAAGAGARPVLAQQPAAAVPAGPIVVGTVVDAGTGKRLAYALVAVGANGPRALTDSTGTFRLAGLVTGVHNITASQLGYSQMTLPVPVADGAEPVEFKLFPDPIALEGIKVMGDRFRGRRNALPVAASAYDQQRLLRSPSLSLMDFLANDAKLSVAMCPGVAQTMPNCFNRRGRVVAPQVFLDEALLTGGMSELEGRHPDDFYLVEVIANGLQIRAYTQGFVDRLAKNPRALEPIIVR
jgi:hypothetical protein